MVSDSHCSFVSHFVTAFWSILNRFEVKIHPCYNADYDAQVVVLTDTLQRLAVCSSTKHDAKKKSNKSSPTPWNVGRFGRGVYLRSVWRLVVCVTKVVCSLCNILFV